MIEVQGFPLDSYEIYKFRFPAILQSTIDSRRRGRT
jgi:hypothetical protein